MDNTPNFDIINSFINNPFGFLDGVIKFIISLFTGTDVGGYTFSAFNIIRNLFIILDVILVILFFIALFASLKFRPDLTPRKPKQEKKSRELKIREKAFRDRWINILKIASQGTPEALKVAIIDADKLADDSLKQLGIIGETMADRIEEITSDEMSSIDRLLDAHRVRNDLVHNPGFEISKHKAKSLLQDYEAFFKELDLLS